MKRTALAVAVLLIVLGPVAGARQEREYGGWLSISNNRTAVYAAGNPAKTSLVWVDREGKTESLGKGQSWPPPLDS